MSISENDALWNNSTKEEPQKNTKYWLTMVSNYLKETKATLAKEITACSFWLSWHLNFIRKSFSFGRQLKLKKQEGKRIHGIKIRNFTLFDANQVNALLNANTIIKWLIIILLVYIAYPFCLGFSLGQRILLDFFCYILNPLKTLLLDFGIV
jgi:hypothetical protein